MAVAVAWFSREGSPVSPNPSGSAGGLFQAGFDGVGLHHQGPGLAGRGRPASEWSYMSPPFDHPKLTRHNGGSMDRLPAADQLRGQPAASGVRRDALEAER